MASDTNLSNEDITGGLAGRYAVALFEIVEELPASEQQKLHDGVAALGVLLQQSDDLMKLIRSPIISAAEQGAALVAVLDKIGAEKLLKSFVALVIAKRRATTLPNMTKQYAALVAEAREEMVAHVTSAHPLADSQLAALKAQFKKSLGKTVQLETAVNEDLLGGLVVKLGSRMIDGSLRHKLNSLKTALNEA